MSKAFLFIALALIIACATAKFYTITVTTAPTDTQCKPAVGFTAEGKFWIIGDLKDAAAITAWKETAGDSKTCWDAIVAAKTDAAVAEYIDPLNKGAACFATGAKAGAATVCGVATAGACDTGIFCATDNQCVDKVCKAEARYVVKIAKDTKEADVDAAVKTAIEAIEYTPPAGGDKTTPCKTTSPTIKVIQKEVSKNWALASIDATGDCKAAIVAATTVVTNVQAAECTVCVDTFDITNVLLGTCPCADPAELFAQARYTLVEGKKQKDAEKFFKDAFAASAGKCNRALTFLPAGTGKFVMQYVYKNPLVDETCKKERDDGASKQADEFKLIATLDSSFKVGVEALVTECASTDVIKCVADDAKCVGLVCGKTATCTAANQVDVCASSVCDVKEGATDGKCNSASVVGYIVAVVAVIAAFVF